MTKQEKLLAEINKKLQSSKPKKRKEYKVSHDPSLNFQCEGCQ